MNFFRYNYGISFFKIVVSFSINLFNFWLFFFIKLIMQMTIMNMKFSIAKPTGWKELFIAVIDESVLSVKDTINVVESYADGVWVLNHDSL